MAENSIRLDPQEAADVEVLYAAMYVLSRFGRSDGASICAKVISELRARRCGGWCGVNGAILMSLLRERLTQAAESLEAHAKTQSTSVEASRIRAKAEGVRLAVVYVEDELRLCGDAA